MLSTRTFCLAVLLWSSSAWCLTLGGVAFCDFGVLRPKGPSELVGKVHEDPLGVWEGLYRRALSHRQQHSDSPFHFSAKPEFQEAVDWMRGQIARLRAEPEPDPELSRAKREALDGFAARLDRLQAEGIPYDDGLFLSRQFTLMLTSWPGHANAHGEIGSVQFFAKEKISPAFLAQLSRYWPFVMLPTGADLNPHSFLVAAGVPIIWMGMIPEARVADGELKSPWEFWDHDRMHADTLTASHRQLFASKDPNEVIARVRAYESRVRPLVNWLASLPEATSQEKAVKKAAISLLFEMHHEDGTELGNLTVPEIDRQLSTYRPQGVTPEKREALNQAARAIRQWLASKSPSRTEPGSR